MKSNEELENKFSEFFNEPVKETKIETQLDLIPSVSESIAWGQPRPKKTIMTEEEFDKIFGDIEI
jgi:hypothetical protein